ncbi:TetR family transcriptional regulator [Nesterenkonia alkaliphila]|uniref:TetR family transcriptional regulator n=2 Tax=Nesterenkonia alkaliphila TaxID=1463631 RepID=A0A7K1UKW4_9MICC|nr:TetR family transcriptional regulator [Nesterenkonia alkaliphila]GFZ90249.1 TetR family transcriptional regulator [Nesterenkonia alkaliphila]
MYTQEGFDDEGRRDDERMHSMADTTETGLPRAVAIAWGMQEVPQRGPNRGLSHERIVAAAIEIADAEGLSAVTMQAVAKSLGFTTMSLYRYVSSKEELLQLMQDAAVISPEKLKLPPTWQEALRAWAGWIREAYRAHPWVLQLPRGQVAVLMPNSVRAADLGLQALRDLPLSHFEKVGIILVVSQHVAATVELEQNLAAEGEVRITAEGVEVLKEVITAERFPHLVPVMEAGGYVAGAPEADRQDEGVDPEYDLGLDLIIAGLERRIPLGS